MLKKVRIKIQTDRTELVGSLFEDSLAVKQKRDAAAERMEMMTEGSYLDDGTRVSISYKESEATGSEGSRTTVSFQKNAPELISVMRTGSVKTALIFEEGRRHHCVYQTPIMPFDVCVYTTKVHNALESEGALVLDYAVELRGADAERTQMKLTLLPVFDEPQRI